MIFTTASVRVLFMSWVFVPQDELTENQEIIQTYRLHIAQDINQDNLALFCQSYNRWHPQNPDLGPIHTLILVIWADIKKFFFITVGKIWRLRGPSWDLMKIQSKHWSMLIGCLFYGYWIMVSPLPFHFYLSLLLLFRCPSLLIVGDTSPAVDAVVSDLSKTLPLRLWAVRENTVCFLNGSVCFISLFHFSVQTVTVTSHPKRG